MIDKMSCRNEANASDFERKERRRTGKKGEKRIVYAREILNELQ